MEAASGAAAPRQNWNFILVGIVSLGLLLLVGQRTAMGSNPASALTVAPATVHGGGYSGVDTAAVAVAVAQANAAQLDRMRKELSAEVAAAFERLSAARIVDDAEEPSASSSSALLEEVRAAVRGEMNVQSAALREALAASDKGKDAAVATPAPAPVSTETSGGGRDFQAVSPREVGFVVITGQAYHETRVAWALETWLKWLPAEVVKDQMLWVTDGDLSSQPGLSHISRPSLCCGKFQSQGKWREGIIELSKRLAGRDDVKWVWIIDDDAFLIVPNAMRLLAGLAPGAHEEDVFYGQLCSGGNQPGNWDANCGGATSVLPRPLFDRLARYLEGESWPPSAAFQAGEGTGQSDRVLSAVLQVALGARFAARREFCSQPPAFYVGQERPDNQKGWLMRDHQAGWGNVVSFHYTSTREDFHLLYHLFTAAFGEEPLQRLLR